MLICHPLIFRSAPRGPTRVHQERGRVDHTFVVEHLVVFGLRRLLEGVLFAIPDDVLWFHRIGLAHSRLPGTPS